MATALIQLIALLAAFAALVAFAGPLTRRLEDWAARRRAARHPAPQARPLQVVAADLRRLARQTAFVPAGSPMVRRRALLAAYDDVLAEAAGMVGVGCGLTAVPEGRAREVERLRVISALRAAGLRVDG
ncbi:hypothetical protein [Blastococcus saxobsidens]|uniref:Uncharacterized protein n=1 Tax=Blastococcus saxobsidens (strain DD2) TaxID=1146883 RepID=H6RQT6_BLASD|nr:hypothetical protein [Blastococcus saxobsidens]CCG01613.1 conserved exported protein of unknown function [Blastococcus saxobsidens DD2]